MSGAAGPAAALLAEHGSSRDGLTPQVAAARLAQYGRNVVAEGPGRTALADLLSRFRNPLVLILVSAAAFAAATGDAASFVMILAIVALGVALDFIQEHRAERAAQALKQSVALTARVRRGGQEASVPAASLVPGDIVLLAAGDLVPADGRVLEARDFFVNQALLSGEPYPVEKRPADICDAPDDSTAFAGTSVISGSATLLVVATGARAQLGEIARTLQHGAPPSAFELGIRDFGLMIVRLTALMAVLALAINLLLDRPPLESLLFALALAVGLTPELLPMITSVTLARGALRMAARRVIVKRLAAIHDLGSMDVLCTDKTGTLTQAHIRLIRAVDLHGADSAAVLRLAYINSAFETGLRSPLDEAVLEHGAVDIGACRKIDEVPFDFERRRVSVLVEEAGARQIVVKGAPEEILALSDRYAASATEVGELDDARRDEAHRSFAALSSEGFRVLAVARRDVPADRDHAVIGDERQLVFAGFVAFLDPPKDGAREALDALTALGVAVKIVTGDNELVTQHVCRALGIPVAGVLTGVQIAALSDEALAAQAMEANLFCRVSPAQKSRIIAALRRRGRVVGYLGDGINDAPSLHVANVGISVDGAVDVAKEAAALIMLDHDLGVLAHGVREGRRTFANIMKYVMMATSSNFGNMLSMATATLFLPFLPMLPIQILLNNLLYDISEIAIPLDAVDPEAVTRPRHWDMTLVRDFMVVVGSISSLFDFLTFGLLHWGYRADAATFHTGWFIESLASQALVIFVIRTAGNPFRSRPHPALALGSIAAVAVAVALPFTVPGAWVGLVPLPAGLLLAIAAMTGTYLCLVQAVKTRFYARHA